MAVCNEILSSPDSFQTKVLIKILTSLVLTHNNYVHLKELKVLAELLLQNVKEKSCVRSLEKFEKQLLDWLAKDPSHNTTTPGANKRKSKGGEGEDSPADKSGDGTLTPTRGRKRILFSQSMIGNPLLNPESGQVLETSEEEALSGTTLADGSFIISPVNNTKGQEEDGDITLVEDASKTPLEGTDADKDDTGEFESAESSLNTDDETTQDQMVETPKLTRKERVKEPVIAKKVPMATIDIEVLPVSDEDDEEDDIFSDASSVASVNLSKLPPGSILDNSSEDSADDIFDNSQSQNVTEYPVAKSKGGSKASKSEASNRSNSSSSLPSSNRSTRSSRSSVASSPTPRASLTSRSSKAAPSSNDATTPPTVKKKGAVANKKKKEETITSSAETPPTTKKAPTAKVVSKKTPNPKLRTP